MNTRVSKVGKPRFSLVPVDALALVIAVLEFGAAKHAEYDWLNYDSRTYFDAAMRHLMAWQGGQHKDPESGITHIAHAATNLLLMIALGERFQNERRRPKDG